MRWIALLAGGVCGGLNCTLLRMGCKRLLGGNAAGGAALIAGGAALATGGLILCAWRSPALLPWFGCACGLALPLLAAYFYVLHQS